VPRPHLTYLLARLHRAVRPELHERLRTLDLSIPGYTALSVLRVRPGLSNAQLARRALITPQSMNDVVFDLERRGLIERVHDPAHRRILRVHVTRAGTRLLEKADRVVAVLEEEMQADLDAEQRELLTEGLNSCMRRLGAGLDVVGERDAA
jgi:DNA-binding MarR family transcriptional regulator